MPLHHPAIHYRHLNPPAIVMKVGDERPVPLTPRLRQEYCHLYTTLKLRPNRLAEVEIAISKIEAGWARYVVVSAQTHVPWYVIGIIHYLECDSKFDRHLHNGDPLAHRTVHAPPGLPLAPPASGHLPYTWEESALDALKYDHFDTWTDWGIAGTLYRFESNNGFGSRNHGVATPYLWGGTTFYTRGKYVKDGIWSPSTVSQQVGAAAILYEMNRRGLIEFPKLIPPTTDCESPPT